MKNIFIILGALVFLLAVCLIVIYVLSRSLKTKQMKITTLTLQLENAKSDLDHARQMISLRIKMDREKNEEKNKLDSGSASERFDTAIKLMQDDSK